MSRSGADPETLLRRGFCPLVVIAALTNLFAPLYHTDLGIYRVLIRMVVEFGAYFAGYFVAIFALSAAMPRVLPEGSEIDDRNIRLFALCMMGLMACIGIARNALPSDFDIINFLYVYLAIIMWRGEKFMHVSVGRSTEFVILAVVAVILPPVLIMMIMMI